MTATATTIGQCKGCAMPAATTTDGHITDGWCDECYSIDGPGAKAEQARQREIVRWMLSRPC